MRIGFLYCAALLLVTSCQNYPTELKRSLEISGRNKNELTKVIDHYSQKPEDSLKLSAAIYLIKNMEGLYSLDTTSVDHNERYFNCLDTLFKRIDARPTVELISRTIDGYIKKKNIIPEQPQANYVEDLKLVKSEFLIRNIDSAFLEWQTNPWSKQMSFDVFCEYILPYRSINTYMINAREYFIHKYSWIGDSAKGDQDCFKIEKLITDEINTWYDEDGTILRKYPFLNPIKFSNIIKGRIGTCAQANALKTAALRALGVPVAMEIVPQWGNYNNSHSFYKVLDFRHDTIKKLLTNINSTKNVSHIISGTCTTKYTRVDELPSFIVPTHNKTVPKVFRDCFTHQAKSLAVLNSSNEEIPVLFQDAHLLDVTSQYLETADVDLKIDSGRIYQYAYLCVFTIRGWEPIQWAPIVNGNAVFKNMGKNMVYLPAFFKNNNVIPFTSPFILQQDGTVKNICKNNETQTLSAWRKYPYFMHVAEWASYMIGAKFQGANKDELSDSKTFYTIKTLPYGMKEISIEDNTKYRYLIYRFDGMGLTFPAEIEFYGIINRKEEKLTGREIGNKGRYGFSSSSIWDGNRNTYFFNDGSQPQTYVGIDLGKGNECKVTKIRFCPRSDTNDILPGENYELFYWDARWVSLGNQKGIDMKPLIFNNVPKNALFWLRTNKGKEERIFTYENGKQIWW